MGPEYSCALRPELARNWSAASHRRFSSEVEAAFFSEGAIQSIYFCVVVLHWRGYAAELGGLSFLYGAIIHHKWVWCKRGNYSAE